MDKHILLIALVFLSFKSYGQESTKTADRKYTDSTGKYVIRYKYEDDMAYRTGNDILHFRAEITVYKRERGKMKLISPPFKGQYTKEGCFEDDPKTLVVLAKNTGFCF